MSPTSNNPSASDGFRPERQEASGYATGQHFILKPCICYSISLGAAELGQRILPAYANDAELGAALNDVLGKSRFIVPSHPDFKKYFSNFSSTEKYDAWVQDLTAKFGFSSRKALFRNLQNCSVTRQDEIVEIVPMKKHGLEGWEGVKGVEPFTLPASADPAEIGATLRRALSFFVKSA